MKTIKKLLLGTTLCLISSIGCQKEKLQKEVCVNTVETNRNVRSLTDDYVSSTRLNSRFPMKHAQDFLMQSSIFHSELDPHSHKDYSNFLIMSKENWLR